MVLDLACQGNVAVNEWDLPRYPENDDDSTVRGTFGKSIDKAPGLKGGPEQIF